MATGASAYTRLEKPDDSISQGLQFWGQMASTEQENEKLRQERESVRKEKADADFASAYGSLEEFKQKVTGFDTYDEIGSDYTNKIRDEYINQYKIAQKARESGNKQELINAEMRMKKLKGTFSQVGDINTNLAKLNEDYVKMAQEGKISGVDADNWEAQMEAIIKDKNFNIELDENGSPMIVGLQKNTDGKEEIFKVKYSDVVNGQWRPYQKVDIVGKGGIIDSILNNLGSYEEIKNKGLVTITSQLWNNKVEEATKAQISTFMSDEVVADILNQINGSKKKTGFTAEEKEMVSNKLLEAVRGGYKEKYKEDFNKDYANYTVDLRKAKETERSNKADEAIARQNANTAAYNARTGRMNAETAAANNTKKEAINIVNTSAIFKTNNGNSYRTYSLSNKDEKGKQYPVPFVAGVDEEGKPINVTSIDVDTKTGSFRYKDNKGVLKTLSYKDDPNLYNTLYSQILGREEVEYSAPNMTTQKKGELD